MAEDGMWFAPKRFGYGAGLPIAWQGWVVVGLYLAVILSASLLIRHHGGLYGVIIIAMTIAILPITAAKTRGGWRWRWGDSD